MSEHPREYDREFTNRLSGDSRLRLGFDTDGGEVTRFVVQLERRRRSGWAEVVRADHNPRSELSHDVTQEVVHLDVYRNGEQYRTEYIGSPMPAGRALDRAEGHITDHAEEYCKRFDEWHRTE